MEEFQRICREKLVGRYKNIMSKVYDEEKDISFEDTYIVWSVKALQNYKCLASTNVDGDGVYAEYTYNGDKKELYEDFYGKLSNICYLD